MSDWGKYKTRHAFANIYLPVDLTIQNLLKQKQEKQYQSENQIVTNQYVLTILSDGLFLQPSRVSLFLKSEPTRGL